jgi:2-polyprenyl-6-methoxyphenol hydroxylase-like FAD-dependent oxidoreductase
MTNPDPMPRAPVGGPSRDTAIVIGGSMAGLLATRVLSSHFAKVILLDRDQFPDGPTPRKGVPQARHAHLLLAKGRMILEGLFPELPSDLLAAGAVPPLDLAADMAWLSPVGWGPRFNSGLTTFFCSRDLLETCVRARVKDLPNVQVIPGTEVMELLVAERGAPVTGVRVRQRENMPDAPGEYHADLVVDASGRSSRAPEWLESLGYGRPPESHVNAFLGYASRLYKRPADFKADWQALFVQTRPPYGTRGGALFPMESGRWLVTLAGTAKDYPPTNEAAFLEFARSLPTPDLYEAISQAEPSGPISGYQRTENQWRHYERLAGWPRGFIVFGDAVCAFNPVYAQGMSAAALGAEVLDNWLLHGSELATPSQDFQRELARALEVIWSLATSEDYRFPGTTGGGRSLSLRFAHWYLPRVQLLSVEDREVYMKLVQVLHLIAPPSILLQPGLILRVLRHGLRRRRKPAAPAAQAAST